MRKVLLALMFLFLLSIITAESFTFAFLTDVHIHNQKSQKGFSQCIEKVNSMNPDFVIYGGDMINDAMSTKHKKAQKQFKLFLELSEKLMMPYYLTFGNHEAFGLYLKKGNENEHPDYYDGLYKRQTGYDNTYYSFDHKGWHFMILNDIGYKKAGGYYGIIDKKQQKWISQELKKLDSDTPICIVVHIPLISPFGAIKKGYASALPEGWQCNNPHEVIPLFKNHNLRLVLQGHHHILEEYIWKDTHFITGGSVCGRWWKGPREGIEEGFVFFNIDGNSFEWDYIDYGWEAK